MTAVVKIKIKRSMASAVGAFLGGQFYIPFVVGHTKNVADCFFNLLKVQCQKKNLYTFDQLAEALGT